MVNGGEWWCMVNVMNGVVAYLLLRGDARNAMTLRLRRAALHQSFNFCYTTSAIVISIDNPLYKHKSGKVHCNINAS